MSTCSGQVDEFSGRPGNWNKKENKMRKNTTYFTFIALLTFAAAVPVRAEEEKTALQATSAPEKMDEAKMAEWKKNAAPNENHKVLEAFVGQWNHTVSWRMSPEAPVQESTGTNTNEWIMSGRFLKQEIKGEAMGEPFEGLGFTGYDNVKQEYTSVWMDSMGTGIMTSSAQYDPATQTIREQGSFSCPMTGEKNKPFRAEWKIVGLDSYRYEMYTQAPDGSEFKSMEALYQRIQA